MWHNARICALLLVLPAAPPLQAQVAAPYTLEQVLSYAFPTSLVVAPDGQRMAWLANQRGHRNVWVAEAPRWEPRKLTAYDDDGGVELSALQWLADSRRLIYIRGHTTNMAGEVANPTSELDGATRDLWLVSTNGGAPRRLAGAVSAVVAPAGARLMWVDGRAAVMLDLDAERDPFVPDTLFTVRSSLADLQWSPDGARIAFSSARDGRAILGVFDTRTDSLRWLTNTVDRDAMPRWSRDGRRIAFIRTVAGSAGYSVWRVDADGTTSRALWKSPVRPTAQGGSVPYPRTIAGSYDIMYGDGFIVVPGEWSGWQHLYAIPEDGGEARDLTPGNGIVETAALSHDGAFVWISANTQGIDHRQLGRVRIRDGYTDWVVKGEAIAWNPAPSPDGSWVAYLRSDHAEPASVYRQPIPGTATRVSHIDASFPQRQLVRPRQVIYTTADGWTVHAQLFLPPNHRAGEKHPGVLFMHGGSRRQMFLGFHNRDYYHHAYAFNQYLASRGYVVMSVNYRSGIGYGTAFRNAPDFGRNGASEYQDIVDAGKWLQRHEYVDSTRIGLWGGSYGGFLTAMGLARNSDIFKAGVDLHGVHDWTQSASWYGRREVVEDNSEEGRQRRELAFRSSPVASMDTWKSPVLIVHADDDRNVAFEASIDLVRRLRQKGDVHFEELYFVDDVHGFLRYANWLETFRRAADFFDRMLRGG